MLHRRRMTLECKYNIMTWREEVYMSKIIVETWGFKPRSSCTASQALLNTLLNTIGNALCCPLLKVIRESIKQYLPSWKELNTSFNNTKLLSFHLITLCNYHWKMFDCISLTDKSWALCITVGGLKPNNHHLAAITDSLVKFVYRMS